MVMIEELTPPQSEDGEPLQLEENELLLEENNDEDASADESLLSPPRGWPECFSTSKALKSFIELELGGRRVRLSEPPADEHAELAEGLGLRASDALTNALRLRSRYGWDVLGGFILFERASVAGSFVGTPHFWNANARGLWIDLTPRRHKMLVLVESARTAVPSPEPQEASRLEALRSDELRRLDRRDAERKAAKKAAKAAEKEAKDREKSAKRAAKEAEARQKQEEIDNINKMQVNAKCYGGGCCVVCVTRSLSLSLSLTRHALLPSF